MQLDYVDDYGDPIEDTSAVSLLLPQQQRVAIIASVARALSCSIDYLCDLDYRDWIDHVAAAKAITWRSPSHTQRDKYI